MQRIASTRIYRFLKTQCLVAIIIVIFFGWHSGMTAAYSAFFGAFVGIVPSLFTIKKAILNEKLYQGKDILRMLYLGETIKIVLTIVLMFLLFHFFKLNWAVFLCAYVGIHILMWFAPFIMSPPKIGAVQQ